jgi:hypothetical protein
MLKNKTAAGLSTRAAKTTNTLKSKAAMAKAQAMRRYNIGAATLDETQARFDSHPAWRAA